MLDPALEVVALRDLDRSLVNVRTPDWYLYLRADEAGFDALVTGDLSQSGQADEMWTLTKTTLSVVTWRRPMNDPVVQWGQIMAYLREVRRLIRERGPSIIYLPSARLNDDSLEKAGFKLSVIAREEDAPSPRCGRRRGGPFEKRYATAASSTGSATSWLPGGHDVAGSKCPRSMGVDPCDTLGPARLGALRSRVGLGHVV